MDEIEVKILKAQVSQRLLHCHFYVLRPVESVPQFGHDEQVFTLDSTSIKDTLDAFSCLLFVSIISRTIEQSVPSFHSIDNCIRTYFFRLFPKSKSN
jgi:hypothetical protein